jgi:hypothetical protein
MTANLQWRYFGAWPHNTNVYVSDMGLDLKHLLVVVTAQTTRVAARLLKLRVRIPQWGRCVLSDGSPCDGLIPRPEEIYRL